MLITKAGKPGKNAMQQMVMEQQDVLDLILRLCNTLAAEKIDYCHWKSNTALDRTARGENDLDLLVNRAHANRFAEILYGLGFKEVLATKDNELPGILNYYGLDQCSGQLVHVHAHFQLILGSDLSKNYRLPLEQPYLEASIQGDLFRTPAPEFELVIFVIRMVLKHSTWDTILMGHGNLSRSEQLELEDLASIATLDTVNTALQRLAIINRGLFDACLQALQPKCLIWARIKTGAQLQKKLRSCERYPYLQDLIKKFIRRIAQPIQERVVRHHSKNKFGRGGLFVAIVGGDGAGKTTLIDELYAWLGKIVAVEKMHMGKPAWSGTTFFIRALLKIGTILRFYRFEGDIYEESRQPHGYPWFIRAVCTARDRYLTYLRARRLSSNGNLVLCDRFSLSGFLDMDGPQCGSAMKTLSKSNWLLNFLVKAETSVYQQIGLPDLLIVMKINPDLAVTRKADESAASVRARCAEIAGLDWEKKSGFVIDASQSRTEVLTQIKTLIWAHL